MALYSAAPHLPSCLSSSSPATTTTTRTLMNAHNTSAQPALRGAADLLARAGRPWRATNAPQPAQTMPTPPMTSTFPPRTAAHATPATSRPQHESYAHHYHQRERESQSQSLSQSQSQSQPHAAYASTSTSSLPSGSSPAREQRPTLPPIAHLERLAQLGPPLTPPDDGALPPLPIPIPVPGTTYGYPSAPSTSPTEADDSDYFMAEPAQPAYESIHPAPADHSSGSNPAYTQNDAMAESQTTTTTASHHHTHHQYQPQSQHHHHHQAQSQSQCQPQEPQPYQPHHPQASSSQQQQQSLPAVTLQPPPPAPPAPVEEPYVVDWLDFTRTRSAHFIAEKTCEMICYLWFAGPPSGSSSSGSGSGGGGGGGAGGGSVESASASGQSMNGSVSTMETPPPTPPLASTPARAATGSEGLFASPTPASLPASVTASTTTAAPSTTTTTIAPSTLQLRASPTFVAFMQKLLETTQVSQSVIVLSLHYIYRLKERNRHTPAQPGSEFRIGVAGLMMGNKFLDDNTYTNKTWADVSGIALSEINRMEREFLLGVQFNLYVDRATYAAWLNLLKGLVLAKERDVRRYGPGARRVRERAERAERLEREREREIVRTRDRDQRERERQARRNSSTFPLSGALGPVPAPAPVSVSVVAPASVQPLRMYTTSGSAAAAMAMGYARAGASGSHRARSTSPRGVARAPAVYLPYTQQVQVQDDYANQVGQYQNTNTQQQSQQSQQLQHNAQQQQVQMQPVQQMQSYVLPAPPYASYPSGTSSAYTSPSPAPGSVRGVTHHGHGNGGAHTGGNTSSGLPPTMHISTAIPRAGCKRTAEAAFSPTSAAFSSPPPPPKRSGPGMGISLRIPDAGAASGGGASSGASSASPLEGLGSFERMSLGGGAGAGAGGPSRSASPVRGEREWERERERVLPKTLSSGYSYAMEDARRASGPQNLYFYTLASSPLRPDGYSNGNGTDTDAGADQTMQVDAGYGHRKARLRYHQPVLPPPNAPYAYADLNAPLGGVGIGYSFQHALQPAWAPTSSNSTSNSSNSGSTTTTTTAGTAAGASGQYLHPHGHGYGHAPHYGVQSQLAALAARRGVQSAATSPARGLTVPTHHHAPPAHALHAYSHTSGHAHGHPQSQNQSQNQSQTQAQGQAQGQGHSLPHFHDDVWARPPAPASAYVPHAHSDGGSSSEVADEDATMGYAYDDSPVEPEGPGKAEYDVTVKGEYDNGNVPRTPPQPQHAQHHQQYHHSSAYASTSTSQSYSTHASQSQSQSHAHGHGHGHGHTRAQVKTEPVCTPPSARIPSAPFANAGPPGVGPQFYDSPVRGGVMHYSSAGVASSSGVGSGSSVGSGVGSGVGSSAGAAHGYAPARPYAYAYGAGYGYDYAR